MTGARPASTFMRRLSRIATVLVLGALATGGGVLIPAAPAHADTVRDLQYWLTDYGFTQAWTTTRGKGATVAVIDTGVDASVTELQGAVVGGADMSGIGSADGQTPIGEESEHGTMVASLLAGRGTGEGNGVIGVAPEADLLTVSVAFGADTGSEVSNDDQIAEGVRWAVDHGADIINMSLTRNTSDWPESWDSAFQYAFDNDVVVVAAAGNRASGTTQVGAPATIPGVVTVAGVDRDKEASFDASSQGITIAVSAPSELLVGVRPDGSHVQWNGTSAATPIVSGLAALIRSAYPDLDAANVINRLITTADPRGQDAPSPIYGYGLIDPPAALNASVSSVDTNPMGDLAQWIRIHRRAEVRTPEVDDAPMQQIVPIADPPPYTPDEEASLLPSSVTIAHVTIPLALLTGFGTLAALLGVGATRHVRRTVRR